MPLTKRFEAALCLAARLHTNQTRKGSETPYIAHLLAVSAIVLEHGGTEDEAIAALLHDAVEDQGGKPTLGQIHAHFGAAVAEIVKGCTDTDEAVKPPWRKRKELYIARLIQEPPSVLLVAAADKLHNVRSVLADYRDLGEDLWPRFTGDREGTLWYYRAVVDSIKSRGLSGTTNLEALVAELERAVAELEREASNPVVP